VTGRRGRRRRNNWMTLRKGEDTHIWRREALDRTKWRNRLRRGFGPVVRQTFKWMNEWTILPNLFIYSTHCMHWTNVVCVVL
jgi:hypothetical protein